MRVQTLCSYCFASSSNKCPGAGRAQCDSAPYDTCRSCLSERGRERTNERKNALKPFARVESIGLKLLLVTEIAVSKGSTVLQTV